MLKRVLNSYLNYRSFSSKRKILVIESDDWGSSRTANLQVLEKLNSISNLVTNDRYTQLDALANSDDLSALYSTLSSVKDKNGSNAKITANFCVANPNFEKIKDSNYKEFFFEPFYETIRLAHGQEILNLWNDGIADKLVTPQLHGREHVHAKAWLFELRNGNKDLLKAFELGSYGIPYRDGNLYNKRKNLQAALDYFPSVDDAQFKNKWVSDSASIFKNYFGFHSNTFIAPAYIWSEGMHNVFSNNHIKTLQGIRFQFEPRNRRFVRRMNYTGRDRQNLTCLVRNAFFEPVSNPKKDWVNSALNDIALAFSTNQPAILSSHRVNFIGSLCETNRTANSKLFHELLVTITQRWPNIEFMSSEELSKYLRSKLQN